MIEIQLEIDGPWIPLVRALTSFDLGISESQRILNAGLTGIRILFESGEESFVAKRYSLDGKQFGWRSASMGAPAFASLVD